MFTGPGMGMFTGLAGECLPVRGGECLPVRGGVGSGVTSKSKEAYMYLKVYL